MPNKPNKNKRNASKNSDTVKPKGVYTTKSDKIPTCNYNPTYFTYWEQYTLPKTKKSNKIHNTYIL